MSIAEVIHRSHKVHGLMKRFGLTRQRTSPACQRCYAGPKCPIQAFYVSHVSLQRVLRLLQQQLNLLRSALSHTTDDTYHTFPGDLFDHLDNTDMLPSPKMGTTSLACENRSPKHLLYGRNIRRKAVNTQQQPTTQSATTHSLYQTGYQFSIAMGAYLATQPETCGHLKGHCQPRYSTLMFHPYFVSLNLTQITGLLHKVFMNLLTMLSCTILPGCHCAFIQSKGGYYGSKRTAMSQKRYHLSYKFYRIFEAIEHCTFALRKCLATNMAYVAMLLETVNTNVSAIQLSSCRTGWIVAKFFTGIHKLTPFISFGVLKGCQWIPIFVNL
jgi:hypothetical protein